MTNKTTKDIYDITDVDFESFNVKRKVISINGRNLPIAIGDRISITTPDPISKTVVGISIMEDGHVAYVLSWFDPNSGQFMNEQLTLTELKLLNRNQKKMLKEQIGYSQK